MKKNERKEEEEMRGRKKENGKGRKTRGGMVTGRNKRRKGYFNVVSPSLFLKHILHAGEGVFSGKGTIAFHGEKSL